MTAHTGPGTLRSCAAEAGELSGRLMAELSTQAPGFEIEDYLGRYSHALLNRPRYTGYNDVKPLALCAEIEKQFSPQGLAALHRLLILHLIERFDGNLGATPLPESILELYPTQFGRMLAAASSEDLEFFHYSNDSFAKDLSICSLHLVPTGARVVDLESGLPRRSILRLGLLESMRALRMVFKELRGFRPLCGVHVHKEILDEFNFEGHERTFRRWSDLLKLYPQVKGILGSAWFYDPEVRKISPHLACVREIPEQNGAFFLKGSVMEGTTSGALTTSRTRRRLYEAGQYQPQRYYMLWPRHSLIAWADKSANRSQVPRN